MRLSLRMLPPIALVLLQAPPAHASDWFVRSAAAGAANGTSWSDAWSWSSIHWSALAPGDTIYVAGGAYGTLAPQASGTATSPISIRRARATNPACTGAAGWSSSFDAQITSTGIGTITQSYVILSGETSRGILVTSDTDGAVLRSSSASVTLAYIEFTSAHPAGSDNHGIFILGATGTTIDHCVIHGVVNGLQIGGWTHGVVQYSELYDISDHGTGAHANVNYLNATVDCTWRYNRIHDNSGMGIAWEDSPGDDDNYLYGNVFYDDSGYHNGIESDSNIPRLGHFYIYDNVFVNEPAPSINFRIAPAGGTAENNIFWHSGGASSYAGLTHDYNFSDTPANVAGEPHGVTGSASPFVSVSTFDFHIVSTTGPGYPRDRGVALDATFGRDPDGNVRGADGAWDIGAYELCTSGACMSAPPTESDAGAGARGAADAGRTASGGDDAGLSERLDAGSMRPTDGVDAGTGSRRDAGVEASVDARVLAGDAHVANDDARVEGADGGAHGADAGAALTVAGGCSCRVSRPNHDTSPSGPASGAFAVLVALAASSGMRRRAAGYRALG